MINTQYISTEAGGEATNDISHDTEDHMAVVNPVPKDKASGDIKPIYEDLVKRLGRVPNFFGVMAHRPEVLKHFVPLYGAIVSQGTVEPKLKELAYLKVSAVNGCEY